MSKLTVSFKNQIIGRALSQLAKLVMKNAREGNFLEVQVYDIQNSYFLKSSDYVLKFYQNKMRSGSRKHGQFFQRTPQRFIKRLFRKMMPYRKTIGRFAFNKVKFYDKPSLIETTPLFKYKQLEGKKTSLKTLCQKLK